MEEREFYSKLLAKLIKIKNNEMTLDNYITEVSGKIKKYSISVNRNTIRGVYIPEFIPSVSGPETNTDIHYKYIDPSDIMEEIMSIEEHE
jgi:hypothetical protein